MKDLEKELLIDDAIVENKCYGFIKILCLILSLSLTISGLGFIIIYVIICDYKCAW